MSSETARGICKDMMCLRDPKADQIFGNVMLFTCALLTCSLSHIASPQFTIATEFRCHIFRSVALANAPRPDHVSAL